ncbi:MAG: preprotein translocase subunit SecG [Methylococcaceae bacterium]|nr:preprotein translocase subunit SecG [Methylococcaceae bacterium]
MYQVIIVVHMFLGLGVVGLVLMQQGKGADAGAAFSGGSGSVFGAQGASSFLSRTTAILAAAFFATSLGLAMLSGYQSNPDDLMDQPVVEQPLEDVPVIGDSKATVDSTPVANTPVVVPDTPVIPEAVVVVPDTVKVEETIIPTVTDETVKVEPAVQVEATPSAEEVVKDIVNEATSATPVEKTVEQPATTEVTE